MKRVLVIFMLVAAVVSLALSQTQDDDPERQGNAEQTLMQIHREWADAAVRGDIAALNRILASDFTDTSADGIFKNRAQYIEQFRGANAGVTFEVSDQQVRVYGNTAVETGQAVLRPTAGGEGAAFRYTTVYVRRQRRWQPVTAHVSQITG